MYRKLLNALLVLALLLGTTLSVSAQDETPPFPVADAGALALQPGDEIVEVAPELAQVSGPVKVVVRLADAPVAVAVGRNAKQVGASLSPARQRSYNQNLTNKQNALLAQIAALGGVPVARTTIASNTVIVEIDASVLDQVAALPGVTAVRPVINYELDLSETVPYIGAAAVQARGVDGRGVDVAVLDSGIDYTHYNLGGSGSVAEYDANDPSFIEPGSFPTWKVVGGYDFTGANWPNTPETPDPDPLDTGIGGGHGTHVADIIGGKSLDGLHKGVAPGVNLWAVKVCSSVSTSCSGVALLQGMDFALDPNGDGSIADAVDVVNMSLGSSYGQREDDLSEASANAVKLGVVVVASAGNSADRPYIHGSPASTPEVIAVAQTQVPSAKLFRIQVGSSVFGGGYQAWSPAPVFVSGPLQYGNGASGNLNGCAPFPPGSLVGRVLLVDRGSCNISLKGANGSAGGALAVVIANNATQAPGDLPPDFSYGGGTITVATYVVTRVDGLAMKALLGQTATIDPSTAAGLVMNMVASSSRGPSFSYNQIKPDVGAPGASLSAEFGSGTENTVFGGTSGAAPMVAGSAALLLQGRSKLTPPEVKALLMNTGETNIGINPVALPGYLAPITRIGGGEVRVDKALAAKTAVWDQKDLTGSLSFGYLTVNAPVQLSKNVVIRNYASKTRTYTVTPSFRYFDDADSGAVTLSAPAKVTVGPNTSKSFVVKLNIDPAKLPVWSLNGGSLGGDGYRLQSVEFDGYLTLADATDTVHVAWQVLPHRAADVNPTPNQLNLSSGPQPLVLNNNTGALDGTVEVFALTGTSPVIKKANLPQPGDNYAIVDLKETGVRLVDLGGSYGLQFAVTTFGKRAHPAYPAEFDIYLDVDRDGNDDFVLYNAENSAFAATGQTLVRVVRLADGLNTAFYFLDADLNSGNAVLTVPLSFLGITPSTQFDFSVYAFDNYFTGDLTDAIVGMTFTPNAPRFVTDAAQLVVPAGGASELQVGALPGGDLASPSQSGLLLLYRSAFGAESSAITVKP